MIDDLIVDKVKNASSIVDVISDFYELRKDGTGYTCLCPFHDDRHLGSFKISPNRNMYKCFSCGATGDPIEFLKVHERLSFEDAVRWLGKKYTIEVPGNENFKVKKSEPRKPTPPLPLLVLDKDRFMTHTLGKDNNLTRWMKSLPWNDEQRARLDKVLKNYFVGTSKQGMTIFWQLDEHCRCRTGKMMLYKTDGHRDKTSDYNFDYIHSILWRNGILDPEAADRELCIFGLHLIGFQPKTVNLVESEKTALICATFWGDMKKNMWMALGGSENLTKEKLKPLIDRKVSIVLYPDMDGIEKWKAKAKEIGYKKLTVADRWMRENWREEDGEKADVADILVRLLSDDVFESDPNMKYLKEKMNLELITVKKI